MINLFTFTFLLAMGSEQNIAPEVNPSTECSLIESPDGFDKALSGLNLEKDRVVLLEKFVSTQKWDYALYITCKAFEDFDSPDEQLVDRELLLVDLEKRSKTKKVEPFDLCSYQKDDMLASLRDHNCQRLTDERIQSERAPKVKYFLDSIQTKSKKSWAKLETSFKKYQEAFEDEYYCSGTGYSNFLGARLIDLQTEYWNALIALSQSKAISYPDTYTKDLKDQLNSRDNKKLNQYMNTYYQKLMSDEDIVSKQDIRKAQRAWIKYRDSFLEFSKIQFKNSKQNEIQFWLTYTRTAWLLDVQCNY